MDVRPGGTYRWCSAARTFAEEGSRQTRVTMRALFATEGVRERHAREYHAVEGGNQTLDRLGAYLAPGAGESEIRTQKFS